MSENCGDWNFSLLPKKSSYPNEVFVNFFHTSSTYPLMYAKPINLVSSKNIDIWICNLDDPTNYMYESYISPEEERTRELFSQKKLQKRYARAHGFLRCVLALYLKQNAQNIVLKKNAQGKPFIENSSYFFNLSHSQSLAVVAVRFGGNVGIDIEYIQDIAERNHIMDNWFSPEEKYWIQHSSDPNKNFLRCWVCREALLKMHGWGLTGLKKVALRPRHEQIRVEDNACILIEFCPEDNYVGAVACS